jgi:hypothetical protein
MISRVLVAAFAGAVLLVPSVPAQETVAAVSSGADAGAKGEVGETGKVSIPEEPVDASEPPYELFEDFDISHLVKGNETYLELLGYRQNLERPSVQFYQDKLARKRWLPLQGVDQTRLYAHYYADELSETGDIEDEVRFIHELLPKEADYAAKPTHLAQSSGIWLVSYDSDTGKYITTTSAMELEEDDDFDSWVVARSLAESLRRQCEDYESWVDLHVRPGLTIEERLVDFNWYDRPPTEFHMFVVWGKVVFGQMNYVNWGRRIHGAFINRNLTLHWASDYKKFPHDWIEWTWPRLVETAEKLGANKDMFRVDFLVGIPSTSPSLRSGRREDKVSGQARTPCRSQHRRFPTFFADPFAFVSLPSVLGARSARHAVRVRMVSHERLP